MGQPNTPHENHTAVEKDLELRMQREDSETYYIVIVSERKSDRLSNRIFAVKVLSTLYRERISVACLKTKITLSTEQPSTTQRNETMMTVQ